MELANNHAGSKVIPWNIVALAVPECMFLRSPMETGLPMAHRLSLKRQSSASKLHSMKASPPSILPMSMQALAPKLYWARRSKACDVNPTNSSQRSIGQRVLEKMIAVYRANILLNPVTHRSSVCKQITSIYIRCTVLTLKPHWKNHSAPLMI